MEFAYLIHSYSKIPEIEAALYEEELMETHDWDEIKASAHKLGQDVRNIAHPPTTPYLQRRLFDQPDRKDRFIRDMLGVYEVNAAPWAALFEVFVAAFLAR